jgi:hypothetical protein
VNKKILFVSHKQSQCGVYEFGKSITDVLKYSKKYQFFRVECSSLAELHEAIIENSPDAIIYNYLPSVMPWIASRTRFKLCRNNIRYLKVPQIGIIHDVTQHVADMATAYRNKYLANNYFVLINSLFDFYIAPDPTLLLLNSLVYKTGRLVPLYQNNYSLSSKPIIGSFGFATQGKGFENIVRMVQQEFDQAVIRFNIPFAHFGDKEGRHAKEISAMCDRIIVKPGIQLFITHDYLDHRAILDFLAQNTINVFLYDGKDINRGISSAIDYAMAVQRPIAVSDSVMFRHLFDVEPAVRISQNNIKRIIQNGFSPLQKHYNEWSVKNLLWEYERILDSIFISCTSSPKEKKGFSKNLKAKYKKYLLIPDKAHTWLRVSDKLSEDYVQIDTDKKYLPVQIPQGISLNRILDNTARLLYKPAIDKLIELVPNTMSKKIKEANVQQGFVFDTVYRYLSNYKKPKILCVGSYEDTASMSLRKIGCEVEEIDPVVNYSVQEYFTKPTTIKNSYDIIFSTSVIEHDSNDELFVQCISDLLAADGVAIITCDYKDGWKIGDPKPECNERFYTKKDLTDRLLPFMENCTLVDKPQWNCLNPDFSYLGKYQYTFATMVIKKNNILTSNI